VGLKMVDERSAKNMLPLRVKSFTSLMTRISNMLRELVSSMSLVSP
jgi:hypothetical protein